MKIISLLSHIIENCWKTYYVSVAIFSNLFSWCVFSIAHETLWIYFIDIKIIYINNEQKMNIICKTGM
jgi:hypothetical protein